MKTKTKRKKDDWEQEIVDKQARLRKYLGRLTTEKTEASDEGHEYRLPLTFRMFVILMRIDEAMIGTPDYMGIAYWWDHEYKHTMRAATPRQSKRAHDAIVAAGLLPAGVSDKHREIIAWATNNGRLAAKQFGTKWTPWRGPRPVAKKRRIVK